VVVHGYETGVITRSADGGYSERHLPVNPSEAWRLASHDRPQVTALPPVMDDNGVAPPGGRPERVRARLSAFWSGHDHPKPTADDVHAAHRYPGEQVEALEATDEEFGGVDELGVPRRH
jgi:ubiquinol-cytochrome c reductase cytochrome b subunit